MQLAGCRSFCRSNRWRGRWICVDARGDKKNTTRLLDIRVTFGQLARTALPRHIIINLVEFPSDLPSWILGISRPAYPVPGFSRTKTINFDPTPSAKWSTFSRPDSASLRFFAWRKKIWERHNKLTETFSSPPKGRKSTQTSTLREAPTPRRAEQQSEAQWTTFQSKHSSISCFRATCERFTKTHGVET